MTFNLHKHRRITKPNLDHNLRKKFAQRTTAEPTSLPRSLSIRLRDRLCQTHGPRACTSRRRSIRPPPCDGGRRVPTRHPTQPHPGPPHAPCSSHPWHPTIAPAGPPPTVRRATLETPLLSSHLTAQMHNHGAASSSPDAS